MARLFSVLLVEAEKRVWTTDVSIFVLVPTELWVGDNLHKGKRSPFIHRKVQNQTFGSGTRAILSLLNERWRFFVDWMGKALKSQESQIHPPFALAYSSP